ncbi:uncharacterized protein LOC124140321 [Haliotis rufescens]|uniref:uncharacterized protein LOC124140321 n=1 Tax=Haliotis rufescens TaxID=6454 RepID=UPI00201F002B|nr:uncharacterized protein LOC124140321 [Haliotis rufescens]
MATSKGHNNANGIISAIVLVFGIILSVVLSVLLKRAEKIINKEMSNSDSNFGNQFHSSSLDNTYSGHNTNSYGDAPIWALGFAYIVPGLIGLISAFTKQKGVYITHMVFSIISLLVMGIFFIVGILAMAGLAVSHPSQCTPIGDKCVCTTSDFTTPTPIDMSCDDINAIYAMAIVLVLVLVFAWILTLVCTILSGILACRHEPVGGVIIQRIPATTTVIHSHQMAGANYAHVQQYQPPSTHDNAKLVTNVEY